MMLVALILLPLVGGVVAWVLGRRRPAWSRGSCVAALVVGLGLALSRWPAALPSVGSGPWLETTDWAWVPQLGIGLRLGLDGLSLLMVLLAFVLGILAVLASWNEIDERVGFFHFNLMWILAGVIGVFLALDLALFYFFWELMLVPMVFLIGIWGHADRIRAAIKFFVFTQVGGLFLLVSILALVFLHRRTSGELTFAYGELLGSSAGAAQLWLLLGFGLAFAVKLPAVPLHTWLPDAHTEAPTAGSVLLAGLLLKTGAYGLIRFAVPLFPEAARELRPWAMALGAIGILYGALLAFAQTDLKRLVAYTSVSHLGFVLLGVFAWNQLAVEGAVVQMICHGLSTGALFILAGSIQERLGSRELERMGGLWAVAPRMGMMALIFALASLGLPGLGNFVGELLVLLGSFEASASLTALAALGLVPATVYSLWIVQRVFHGPLRPSGASRPFADLGLRESVVLGSMAIGLFWLGLHPQPVLDLAGSALTNGRDLAAAATASLNGDAASLLPRSWP